ncbi:MAG: Gfo/Idh/MocA family protein, partial [Pirellulales bacterium]
CEQAAEKGLSIVSGLCWRYDNEMRATFQQIHEGGVGDIVAMQCTYNTGGVKPHVPRQSDWSDMEYQIRNWYYYTWLSGDHNVEQHIHSLDKMAWALQDQYPVRCTGTGGRQVRTDPKWGNIFDHFSVVYEYADGVKAFSYCRQQEGCAKNVSDHVMGTQGTCDVFRQRITGGEPWRYRGPKNDMYKTEHDELLQSILSGQPINNGQYMAKSTLMAIMGRMSAYTGQIVTWEEALNSQHSLSPPAYEWGPLEVAPVAVPGVTKLA